jgi:hypothetical protein
LVSCSVSPGFEFNDFELFKKEELISLYPEQEKIEQHFVEQRQVVNQDGQKKFLTAHSYPNFLQDGSFANLQEFTLTTHPTWRFEFDKLILTKEILLLHEENTILIKYKVTSSNKKSKISLITSINELAD